MDVERNSLGADILIMKIKTILLFLLLPVLALAQFNPFVHNPWDTNIIAIGGTDSNTIHLGLQYFSGATVIGLVTNVSASYVDDATVTPPLTNAWSIYSMSSNALLQIPVNNVMRHAAATHPPMYFNIYQAYGENCTPYDYTNLVYAMVTNGWLAVGYDTVEYDQGIATNRDGNGHWIPGLQQATNQFGGSGVPGTGELNGNGPQTGITKLNIPLCVPWARTMGVKTWLYTEPNQTQISYPYLGSPDTYLESDIWWLATNGVTGLKFDTGGQVTPLAQTYWNLRVAAAMDATGIPMILNGSIAPYNPFSACAGLTAVDNDLRTASAGMGRAGSWGMDNPPASGVFALTNAYWSNIGNYATNAPASGQLDIFCMNLWVREMYLLDGDFFDSWVTTAGVYKDHEVFMLDTTNTMIAAFSLNAVQGHALCPKICPDDPVFAAGGSYYTFLRGALKNRDVIAIDQDSAGAPPVFVVTNGFNPYGWYYSTATNVLYMTNQTGGCTGYEVIARPLGQKGLPGASSLALFYLNRSITNSATATCNFTNLNIPPNTPVYCYDVWANYIGTGAPAYFWATNSLTFTLAGTQSKLLKLWPQLSGAQAFNPSSTVQYPYATTVNIWPSDFKQVTPATMTALGAWQAPCYFMDYINLPTTGTAWYFDYPKVSNLVTGAVATIYYFWGGSGSLTMTNHIKTTTQNSQNAGTTTWQDSDFVCTLTNNITAVTIPIQWCANSTPDYSPRDLRIANNTAAQPPTNTSQNVQIIRVNLRYTGFWTNTAPDGFTVY